MGICVRVYRKLRSKLFITCCKFRRLPIICTVLDIGSSEDFCVQSFVASVTLHLRGTLYENVPKSSTSSSDHQCLFSPTLPFTCSLQNKTNSVVLVRKRTVPTERPPLVGEVGTSSSLQIQRFRVRFPALPIFFLRSSGFGTGSTQPREDD
jgi:hypothetical protein